MNIRIEMLKEAYNYKGNYFVENMNLSDIIKNLSNDIKMFGEDTVREVYVELLGEEFGEILDTIMEDKKLLESVSTIKDGLLFEADVIGPLAKNWSMIKPVSGVVKTGVMERLRYKPLLGLWNNIKTAGANLMDRIGLGKLGLFKGGLGGFLKVATGVIGPALLVFGSVAAVVKIMNKLRKKAKMQPVPQKEISKIKDYAERNAAEINNQRIKAGQKPLQLT
jgi:hypothetical protein